VSEALGLFLGDPRKIGFTQIRGRSGGMAPWNTMKNSQLSKVHPIDTFSFDFLYEYLESIDKKIENCIFVACCGKKNLVRTLSVCHC
jgi:hypothetical protein